MVDQQLDKWQRWCEEFIKPDVIRMHMRRSMWRSVQDMLSENDTLPTSHWWDFMSHTYSTTQALAIRRQADTNEQAASLGRLLSEVEINAHRIGAEWWVGLWPDHDERLLIEARRWWRDGWGGSVGDHLDPAIPAGFLQQLTDAAEHVKHYVDWHVAHLDRRAGRTAVTLTLGDLHDAIDVIGTVFQRVFNLLTASSMIQLEPVVQYNWMAVFEQPWRNADANPLSA
ncbi:MAG TPA: hypothetical protein VGG41_07015 [Solirubrobacteraceae bacterium]